MSAPSDRRDRGERPSLAWIALGIVVALYLLLQVAPLLAQGGGHQNDFKHVYVGALFLAEGRSPYDAAALLDAAEMFASEDPRFARGILPYVYLPFTGQVLRPLSWLSFAHAAIVFQLLNHVLLAAGLVAAAHAGRWRWSWKTVLLIGAAATLNFTVQRQNAAGQLNMVLVAGYAVVALGLVRGWSAPVVGGIAAFLMLFKLSPGILLIFFLMTRRWHHAAWMFGWAAGLGLLSMLWAGPRTTFEFLPLLGSMGYGSSTWAEYGMTFWRDAYNQSPNAFLHRVLVDWPGMRPWLALPPALANALTWCFSLAVLGVLAWRLIPRQGTVGGFTLRAQIALAVVASLLLPSLMWDHYLVQGLVAVALVWHAPLPARALLKWRLGLAAIVAIWCLGFHFPDFRVHFVLLAQPLLMASGGEEGRLLATLAQPLLAGFALPGWGPLEGLFGALKLWPTVALFGLIAWACGWRDSDEEPSQG